MSNAQVFTDTNFQEEVLNSDQTVLVDFWAAWCGPCRALGPTIDELADQYQGLAKIGKVDVDKHPEMAAQHGISSIPAVLVFRRGEVVETLIGLQPKDVYEKAMGLTTV